MAWFTSYKCLSHFQIYFQSLFLGTILEVLPLFCWYAFQSNRYWENAFIARHIGIGQYISATWETEAEGFKANLVNLEDCLKIENKTELRMLPYIQHLLSIHKFLCTSPSAAV